MSRTITINNREIGPGRSVYCIAEMSANHNHDFDEAVRIIRAAKDSGADAIKIQTYTPDTMTIRCDKPCFMVGDNMLWKGKNLYDLYAEAFTPWEWQPKLKEIANELGMDLFSTAYDETSLAFLEDLDVPCHKIASFENTDLPLIAKIAATGRPIIMSTGMANLAEIEAAVRTIRTNGNPDLVLLKCTSAYPAPPEDINLATIPHLADAFDVATGLSDHTLGIAAPVAAVALGACVIEKHFTISRDNPGPDSAFSLEPAEFKAMVEAVRVAEKAVGRVSYEIREREAATRRYRRSLFAVEDIAPGEPFTAQNVRSIRPADGLPPAELPNILGRAAAKAIERGTPLAWNLVG